MAKDKEKEEGAKAETSAAAPAKAKKGKFLGPILILNSLLVLFLLKQAFIFFMFAMLPSIVAYLVDPSRQKHSFFVIFACNLAGALPHLSNLVKQGMAVQALHGVMNNPLIWLTVYSAAGFGWLLNWLSPHIGRLLIELLHVREVEQCRGHQKKLVEDWGDDVRQGLE